MTHVQPLYCIYPALYTIGAIQTIPRDPWKEFAKKDLLEKGYFTEANFTRESSIAGYAFTRAVRYNRLSRGIARLLESSCNLIFPFMSLRA